MGAVAGHQEIRLRMPTPLRILGFVGLVGGGAAVVASLLSAEGPTDVLYPLLISGPVLWFCVYLVSTMVGTDVHGLRIVHGGITTRRLSWNEIASFQLHRFDPLGGGSYGPRIWVFCWDFDPRRPNATRPPRWDYFPLPLHWPYVGWRRMRELHDLKIRLDALKAARANGRESSAEGRSDQIHRHPAAGTRPG